MSTIPVLNGNTIILPFKFVSDATAFAVEANLTQFAVRQVPDGFSLSTPVTKALEDLIPGIIHGARCRAEGDKPKPTGPRGGPKGTPPQGGSPAAGKTMEFVETQAVAA